MLRNGIRAGIPGSAFSAPCANPSCSPLGLMARVVIRTIALAVSALAVSVSMAAAFAFALPAAGASDATPLAATAAAPAAIGPNLSQNGDLSKGAGNSPDHWRTESWDQRPAATTYRWDHPASGGPGELEVDGAQANDARWMQSLSLGAGWYYMSVDARTENVGTATGATISVMEDGISSQDLKGTVGWTPIGLYLKVGRLGADIELALRLGGYASLNTGRAFFRNASVVLVAAPPPGVPHVFDLDAIRKQAQAPQVGEPWTLVAVFILLGAVAVVGWQLYGEAVTNERQRVHPGRPAQPGRSSQPMRPAPIVQKERPTQQERPAQSGRAVQPDRSAQAQGPDPEQPEQLGAPAPVKQLAEGTVQEKSNEGRKRKGRKRHRSRGPARKPAPPKKSPAS